MDKKEFIRIVRELQKLQIKLLKSSNMSISMSLNNSSVDSSNYSISLFLFTSDEKNIVKDVKVVSFIALIVLLKLIVL